MTVSCYYYFYLLKGGEPERHQLQGTHTIIHLSVHNQPLEGGQPHGAIYNQQINTAIIPVRNLLCLLQVSEVHGASAVPPLTPHTAPRTLGLHSPALPHFQTLLHYVCPQDTWHTCGGVQLVGAGLSFHRWRPWIKNVTLGDKGLFTC